MMQAYKEMQQLDREAENFATHVLVSAISRKFSTAVPTGEFEQHKYSQYMNRELVTEGRSTNRGNAFQDALSFVPF